MRKIIFALTLLAATPAFADTLTLSSGSKVTGVVIYQDKDAVRMWTPLGINSFTSADFADLTRDKAAASSARIGDFKSFLACVAKSGWGKEFRQIPATVIDKGILQRVPYLSFQVGEYELNVYGDPAAPACIEIGVRGKLLKDDAAKANCKKFIKSILADAKDFPIVEKFGEKAETQDRAEYTFELTPPEAADSYGGWWISVYSKKLLDASRASEKEMAAITEKIPAKDPATKPATKDAGLAALMGGAPWTPDELKDRRQVTAKEPSAYSDSVYVRTYNRDGGLFSK